MVKLSLGRMPWDPPGTGEGGRLGRSAERPLIFLGGRHETVPISSWALMRSGALCPAHLRTELQNIKPLSSNLDLAPQQPLSHSLHCSHLAPFVSGHSFYCVNKDHRELTGPVASFLCLGKQYTAKPKSGSSNQSGLGFALLFCVCELDSAELQSLHMLEKIMTVVLCSRGVSSLTGRW